LEKSILTSQVWAFFAQIEIAAAFKKYAAAKQGIETAITSLESQITKKKQESAQKESEIRSLEKSVTSVNPSVNDINKLLQGFGFKNFSIEATGVNRYRLRRADGSDAKGSAASSRSCTSFICSKVATVNQA
jgi:wobble nucleotide-excising tRNase